MLRRKKMTSVARHVVKTVSQVLVLVPSVMVKAQVLDVDIEKD